MRFVIWAPPIKHPGYAYASDPRFLRDFEGDLQKKKGLHSSDPRVFANFRVAFTNKQKTGTFPPTPGTPGHGLKTGTVPAKPGRMVNLRIDAVEVIVRKYLLLWWSFCVLEVTLHLEVTFYSLI